MTDIILRKSSVASAYPERVRRDPMDDGYELSVGQISEQTDAGMQVHWSWSCPGAGGRAASREEAMTALKAAWATVTEDVIIDRRHQQEWTESKYALWDAGYRDLSKPIRCKCGETFDVGSHDVLMAHIEHIKTASRRA